MRIWTRTQRLHGGRVDAYASVARELNPHGGVYGHFAQYLLCPQLPRMARLSIAAMRLQCNAFVCTHAGYRESELYGMDKPYRERKCIWPPCAAERHLDDALHVLLQCPHFAAHRPTYLQRVNVALGSIGHSLADLGTPAASTMPYQGWDEWD